MTTCFLRMGSDYLEDAVKHDSIKSACEDYRDTANELARYGQRIEASIHIAESMEEVVEYPDYMLSLGKFGGLKKERT